MAIPARLGQSQTQDRRSADRRTLSLASALESTGEDVAVHDLSTTGMLIETAAVLAPFERLEIALPHVGIAAAVIIWNSGRYYGCEFEEPLSPATISAALLRSTPEGGPISLRGSPAPNSIPLEKRSARRSNAQSAAGRESYEAKWSLAASAWFILGTALGLWALIIGAVIAAMKLVEALWS